MKEVNYQNHDRFRSFENFIGYTNPTFSLTARLDVTNIFKWCKKNKHSFFIEFLFILMKNVNRTECFRVRLKDKKPVLFDVIHPGYVVISEEGSINTCKSDYMEDHDSFYKTVRETLDEGKKSVQEHKFNDGSLNLIYVSCVPWLDFSSVNNPYNYTDIDETSIPRITMGKAVEENGRFKMSIDISAHHALMDGYNIYIFLNELQKMIESDCYS